MKYKILLNLFTIALLSTLIGCSTTLEKAEKLMASGDSTGAIELYGQVLNEDPKNEDARIGLRLAQLRWIDQSLIQVRLLRLGQNFGESEKVLREVITKQNLWKVFPQGVVFATQKEELAFLENRVRNGIDDALKNERPLLAEGLFRQNELLFVATLQKDITPLKIKIQQAGRKFCQSTDRGLRADEHYLRLWLIETCKIWSVELPKRATKNSVRLFSKIDPALNVSGFNVEYSGYFADQLKRSFQTSLWYDNKAQNTLPIVIKGAFEAKISQRPARRRRDYVVQESYKEAVVKPKQDDSKSDGIFAVLDLIATLAGSGADKEVDNGDGTVTVYETRYRNVDKTFNYQVVEHRKELRLGIQGSANLRGNPLEFEYADAYDQLRDEHNVSFAAADISPEQPNFAKDADWLRSNSESFFHRVSIELSNAWRNRFCNESKKSESISLREHVFRCAHGLTNHKSALVDVWFEKEFGLAHDEVSELVSRQNPRAENSN